MYKRMISLLVPLSALALLSACSAGSMAVGTAATVGIASAQEGGLSQAAEDLRIRAEINDLWFRHDTDMFRKVSMTVREGRVLLTGQVQDPDHRVHAVRLAWKPEGVSQVINEVRVEEGAGISGFAKDTLITTRLRAKLTFDADIDSLNYSIDTVNGAIYLMGVARNQTELDEVIAHARSLSQVREVVSYVRLDSDKAATDPE